MLLVFTILTPLSAAFFASTGRAVDAAAGIVDVDAAASFCSAAADAATGGGARGSAGSGGARPLVLNPDCAPEPACVSVGARRAASVLSAIAAAAPTGFGGRDG